LRAKMVVIIAATRQETPRICFLPLDDSRSEAA
jgi:hypothetical protein